MCPSVVSPRSFLSVVVSFSLFRSLCPLRVFDLRNSLVVCPTWERVWSCVPPEKEFGRGCDLKKSLVLCSTGKRIWSCFSPWERVWSYVRPEKESGCVFDLRESWWCVNFTRNGVTCLAWRRVQSCFRTASYQFFLCLVRVYCLKENYWRFRSCNFSLSCLPSGERRRRLSLLKKKKKRACGYSPVTRRWICWFRFVSSTSAFGTSIRNLSPSQLFSNWSTSPGTN